MFETSKSSAVFSNSEGQINVGNICEVTLLRLNTCYYSLLLSLLSEMACNQVSIFAGVEGLIIALLVICIVSLTVRLR